uniref:Uncharacterized protein n=1 Tax=Desulfovibrio sp. U5L TaxID=596152 RepID=I2PYU7_9BACT
MMDTFLLDTFLALDALLVAPFRLVPDPAAGFLLGMATLAVASAGLGRLCVAGLARLHRVRREREEGETRKHHELSLRALQAGDKAAYQASNRLAREAYGNAMALAAGRAAALLWPACAALAWACWRFAGVPLPLVGDAAGPAAFFIPAYLLAQWGLSRLLRKPPARRDAPPADLPPSPFG